MIGTIPAGILTDAQQQLGSFEGIVIGMLGAVLTLLIACFFLIVKIGAQFRAMLKSAEEIARGRQGQ